MIEELLLALNGYPGDIFYPSASSNGLISEDGIPKWNIAPELIDYLHPGDQEVLKNVLNLAAYVVEFNKFIDAYGSVAFIRQIVAITELNSQVHDAAHRLNSMNGNDDHIRNNVSPTFVAMTAGLSKGFSLILDSYHQQLVELESALCNYTCNGFRRPSNALSRIASDLQPYFRTFPVLYKLLTQINTNTNGGEILSYICSLYEMERGELVVMVALETVLRQCLTPFATHLLDWLATGQLKGDTFGEFFIQEVKEPRLDSSKNSKFIVRKDFVPSFMSEAVISKILFIGTSISTITETSSNIATLQEWEACLNPLSSAFKTFLSGSSMLNSLYYDDLRMQIEKHVEQIRQQASERLYTYCFQDTNAIATLDAWVKNAFFLGKGELFLTFIDAGESVFSEPLASIDQLTKHKLFLANCWTGSLDKIYWLNDQEEELFRKIRPKFDLNVISPGKVGLVWDAIKFQVDVPQRLLPIFTPTFLDHLNRLFQFLLRWRRTQALIELCWFTLKKSPTSLTKLLPKLEKIHQLTALMLFVVKNLQYYLHVEVLESVYTQAIEDISMARDFERVLKILHIDMIDKIANRCFLKPRISDGATSSQEVLANVGKVLKSFGNECNIFATLVLSRLKDLRIQKAGDYSHSAPEIDRVFAAQVHGSYVNFQRTTALLFKLLTSSKLHDDKFGLSHLLLRLDFNNYFSSTQLC